MNPNELKIQFLSKMDISRYMLTDAVYSEKISRKDIVDFVVKMIIEAGVGTVVEKYDQRSWATQEVSEFLHKKELTVNNMLNSALDTSDLRDLVDVSYTYFHPSVVWLKANAPWVLEHILEVKLSDEQDTLENKFASELKKKFESYEEFKTFFQEYEIDNDKVKDHVLSYARTTLTGMYYSTPESEIIDNNDKLVLNFELEKLIENIKNRSLSIDVENTLKRAWEGILFCKKFSGILHYEFSIDQFYYGEESFEAWKKEFSFKKFKHVKQFVKDLQDLIEAASDVVLSPKMNKLIDEFDKIPQSMFHRYDIEMLYFLSEFSKIADKVTVTSALKLKIALATKKRRFSESDIIEKIDQEIDTLLARAKELEKISRGPKFQELKKEIQKFKTSNKLVDTSSLNRFESTAVEEYAGYDDNELVNQIINQDRTIDEIISWYKKIVYKTVKPEAPKSAPLQKFAFGDQRKGISEPNTEIESELYYALKNHITANEHMDVKYVEMIKGFIRDGLYKTMFRKPKNKYAFRGMSGIPIPLKNLIKKDKSEKDRYDKYQGEIMIDFKFSSRQGGGKASSWSSSPGVAFKRFTSAEVDEGCVLIARTDDPRNSFMTGDFYDLSSSIRSYRDEKEFIALGDVYCFCVLWREREIWYFNDFSEEIQKLILDAKGNLK